MGAYGYTNICRSVPLTIPTYLFYFIAAGTVAVLTTILYGLNRALADARWPAADRTRTLSVAALILLGWLAIAITLSALGTYHVHFGSLADIRALKRDVRFTPRSRRA